MLKSLQLLAAVLCGYASFCQRTDTLLIFYKTDKYDLSKADKQKLDSFISKHWDQVTINGYTDETDEEDYNLDLSFKRSGEVYKYLLGKKVPDSQLLRQFFGESKPAADNSTEEGRALSRRTEIIGYRTIRKAVTFTTTIRPKPIDPMLPVTRVLDNGFMVTYRPGSIPWDVAESFESGSGENFQLVRNTQEMRRNNLYNNTTNGELLSSVLIFRGKQFNPCKLDTPIFVRVPVPYNTNCPIRMVKFFSATVKGGVQIWQEESRPLVFDTVGGVAYMGIWIKDFCNYYNFDFKIDPDCYELDSTQLLYTNASLRNLTAELTDMNSVYFPRKSGDSVYNLVYLKNRAQHARLSFAIYNGNKRIRSFTDEPLSALPFNQAEGKYEIRARSYKFSFEGVNIFHMALKVNKEKYRKYTYEQKGCEVFYLHRPVENITVELTVIDKKGNITPYTNLPIDSFPVDEATGSLLIDRDYIKALKEKRSTARL